MFKHWQHGEDSTLKASEKAQDDAKCWIQENVNWNMHWTSLEVQGSNHAASNVLTAINGSSQRILCGL